MAVQYNKLFKLLIDRKITNAQLIKQAEVVKDYMHKKNTYKLFHFLFASTICCSITIGKNML